MDALAYKMQSIGISFAVQELKVKDPLKEEFMSNNQLILQDRVLEDYPVCNLLNRLALVRHS